MEKNAALFETALTDGTQFRKYKKISGYLIALFFVLSLGFVFLSSGYPEEKIDEIQHPFAIFSYSLLAIAIVFYLFSIKKRPWGTLKIFEDKIEIQEKPITTYAFNQLTDLEIQRGSTYHYAHQISNEIVKVSNFLRFKSNGESKEYEFTIDSKKKNEAFESMIGVLQQKQIKLHYTSI